jgi:hypothetical protein
MAIEIEEKDLKEVKGFSSLGGLVGKVILVNGLIYPNENRTVASIDPNTLRIGVLKYDHSYWMTGFLLERNKYGNYCVDGNQYRISGVWPCPIKRKYFYLQKPRFIADENKSKKIKSELSDIIRINSLTA